MRQIRRIDGPYPNGPKWRLRVVLLNGERRYHADQYDTEEQAKRAKRAFREAIRRQTGPAVREALTEYETFLAIEAGNQPRSIESTMSRLRGFFADVLEQTLSGITSSQAANLKWQLDERPSRQGPPGTLLSRETRRGTLCETKTFIRWAAEKGYADKKAFDELRLDQTRGKKVRRSRGKPKLRDHERMRWWATAVELAEKGDEGALASMMCLDGNLRSSEVMNRQVRDVEQKGERLVIEWGKTRDSDRTVKFGGDVARLLERHVARRDPFEPLIRAELGQNRGGAEVRTDRKGWLHAQCIRICKAAGVPRVTPHGLRGTGMGNDLMRIVLALVQAKGGHALGSKVTKESYIDAGVWSEAERLLREVAAG
ncbi:MAG TPA: hypothetical protein VMU50_08045 [Polyangia bacterium]|nr:hypothetical protein [Polyangia bacterium]